jgi:hypothetical protein
MDIYVRVCACVRVRAQQTLLFQNTEEANRTVFIVNARRRQETLSRVPQNLTDCLQRCEQEEFCIKLTGQSRSVVL